MVLIFLIVVVVTMTVVILMFPLLIVRSRFCRLGRQGSAAESCHRNHQD